MLELAVHPTPMPHADDMAVTTSFTTAPLYNNKVAVLCLVILLMLICVAMTALTPYVPKVSAALAGSGQAPCGPPLLPRGPGPAAPS